MAETAIAAKKEMAKFRLQNIPVGNHTDRLNLKTFFDNTLENIARKEKWDNRTLNVVKAMSSFASDDIGVSLEQAACFKWLCASAECSKAAHAKLASTIQSAFKPDRKPRR